MPKNNSICYDSIKTSRGNSPVREYVVVLVIVCGLIFNMGSGMLKAKLDCLVLATS